MLRRSLTALAAALLLLAPAAHAAVTNYAQNFESMSLADPSALSADGWMVYGNVFAPDGVTYLYGYGPYPAPNPGGGFSALVADQGGVTQGAVQLSVYNDYNNQDHGLGRWIEANVYREQTIEAADVNKYMTFAFDAKMGNLELLSTAVAFIKTLNPSAGWALTNFLKADMTTTPATWTNHSISLPITAGLVGQVIQFGFANTATAFQGSGVFYDNVTWVQSGTLGVDATPRANALALRPAAPNPFAISTRFDFALPRAGAADVGVYDVSGRRVATLFHGVADAGAHTALWDGRTSDGRAAAAGVYLCVLQTADGRQARPVVLAR